MIILAIETSCDETSIAVMANGKILSNIIFSQIDIHQKYGGVVPEVAARAHLEKIAIVFKEALETAKIKSSEIHYVAYTATPGLIGALHIGKVAAQAISVYLQKPLIACNHIQGHIYAAAINDIFHFPLLALVVSGGHTQLILMTKHLDFQILGQTLDDAVGEAYDKVARILGLPYPGGPIIDKLAKNCQKIYALPSIKDDGTLNFSFSGLKSAVINLFHKIDKDIDSNFTSNLAGSFQKVAISTLILKLKKAISIYKPKMIILVGGVAANSQLRKEVMYLNNDDCKVVIPPLEYCTDNAAMIARLAMQIIKDTIKK